jgi:hypothetical protein
VMNQKDDSAKANAEEVTEFIDEFSTVIHADDCGFQPSRQRIAKRRTMIVGNGGTRDAVTAGQDDQSAHINVQETNIQANQVSWISAIQATYCQAANNDGNRGTRDAVTVGQDDQSAHINVTNSRSSKKRISRPTKSAGNYRARRTATARHALVDDQSAVISHHSLMRPGAVPIGGPSSEVAEEFSCDGSLPVSTGHLDLVAADLVNDEELFVEYAEYRNRILQHGTEAEVVPDKKWCWCWDDYQKRECGVGPVSWSHFY